MITNERQYRITRAEADKFRAALNALEATEDTRDDVHPLLLKAEREALESQLSDLLFEIDQYEALLTSEAPVIEVESFGELANGLIKARIAAGLSQKDLAERLGLKPQQIQRYEAEQYSGASLKRLTEIVDALNIRVTQDIFVPFRAEDFDGLSKKVEQVGLSQDFLISRLLPSKDAARLERGLGESEYNDGLIVNSASESLDRVFGWTRDLLFSDTPLPPPELAAAEARFKMPAARSQKTTSAYAAYAHYLALLVLQGSPQLEPALVPDEPDVMRSAILDNYHEISFRSCLNYAWDLGVAVLPLRDAGTFHGACWRYDGRNVIVLKQRSGHIARWLFDLLHELYHTSQHPNEPTFEVIEMDETSAERRESDEEVMASQFAGEVCLDGRAEELAELCVQLAKGRVQNLKSVVQNVAEKEDVDVGLLANYLAFRLSWQDINWWGAAANLQKDDADPWEIAREVFFERFAFEMGDERDRGLLQRALEGA